MRRWLALFFVALTAAAAQPRSQGSSPAPASEQTSGAKVAISLQDALKLAEERSESIVSARADVLRAEAEQMRATSSFLPQINASVAYDHPIRSEFDDIEFPGAGAFPADAGVEIPDAGDEVILPFGLPTWRVMGSVSQTVFSWQALARQRLARSGEANARIGFVSAKAQAALDVTQSYFDAVLTRQLAEIAEATLGQARVARDHARISRKLGARSEFDVLRAEVAYENQVPVVHEQRLTRDLAMLRLKQLLEIPADTEVILTTDVADEGLQIVLEGREVQAPPEASEELVRAPVKQAAEAVNMSEAGVDMARGGHIPTLALTASGGWVGYANRTFVPPPEDFVPTLSVGFTLQIPIFSGFRVTGDVRAAEADLMQARARMRQTEELALLDSLSAKRELQTAALSLEASAAAERQAERAYQIAELRYREGISTQVELDDSRLQLQQARASKALAARDLQVSRMRVALLPNLPLAGMGQATSGVAAGAGGFQGSGGSAGFAGGGAAGAGQSGAAMGGASAAGFGGASGAPGSGF